MQNDVFVNQFSVNNAYMVGKWVFDGVEFQVGDTVKIVGPEEDFASNGMGEGVKWDNQWSNIYVEGILVSGMSLSIGKEYVIDAIDDTGVYFVANDSHPNPYGYPLSALEKVMSVKERTLH